LPRRFHAPRCTGRSVIFRQLFSAFESPVVLAQTGLSFDLSTVSGKLMRTIMAGLAEFERDLIRERVKSGLAAAQGRGVKLGRQPGQRPSDKKAKRVLDLHKEGLSYRLIGRNLGLSKNTVMDIVRREAAA
jgi:putative DNA-invertase from lambdoid prophage Rac